MQKGIHDDVLFLGETGRRAGQIGTLRLMLLPSELESFGLAALEAMACEVVPIATRVGGLPEVIDHGKNGFLTEVGDVDAMANYAIEMLEDPARTG